MAEFPYRAIDRQGTMLSGTLSAVTRDAAIAQLRQMGHMPIHVGAAGERSTGSLIARGLKQGPSFAGISLARRSLTRAELSAVTRELAVMLGAGQDMDRALRFLAETAGNTRTTNVMQGVRDRIRGGQALHLALSSAPGSFPPLYLGMVRAAEASGDLTPTMDRLATLLERERALASTVQSAMIYPAILTLTAIGSVTLLLTKVLPQFTPLFEQNGATLPASTRLLTAAGAWLGQYGTVLLLVFLGFGLVVRIALRRPSIRHSADTMLLRLPGLGALMREVLAARFARILGTLLVNGVPLLTALGIVRDALGNSAATRAITEASNTARSGGGLSASLAQAGIFPVRLVHLLQLGEETARLGPMALRAADIHEDQAKLAIQRLVAILVPAITIVMGLAVAGIVSSLLLAMLSLNDLAQ
ncbi:type II secretion system F family protein [Asaia lannensis]|uniref:Type II secretion system F family protein n=1 Tax=Asaia lannensis NBRC 102526 TaxID=1307926 RepID=A0ABT1CI96_9PROT|nr:type II secretion system F family protein [Asaia lannensis]MCO6160572.1 type II secretion system F family protein [Asaia lannensis NBRC 102526]